MHLSEMLTLSLKVGFTTFCTGIVVLPLMHSHKVFSHRNPMNNAGMLLSGAAYFRQRYNFLYENRIWPVNYFYFMMVAPAGIVF